jgi:DNA-binding response OmpR family regulator
MKHILLLEADQSIVDMLSTLLEEAGYYVSSTTKVSDAKGLLERVRVDLLIADILLPDGTAFPAIDEARKRNVACLLMTGSFRHMAELKANGEVHLSKPFRLKDFISHVIQHIGPGDSLN